MKYLKFKKEFISYLSEFLDEYLTLDDSNKELVKDLNLYGDDFLDLMDGIENKYNLNLDKIKSCEYYPTEKQISSFFFFFDFFRRKTVNNCKSISIEDISKIVYGKLEAT